MSALKRAVEWGTFISGLTFGAGIIALLVVAAFDVLVRL